VHRDLHGQRNAIKTLRGTNFDINRSLVVRRLRLYQQTVGWVVDDTLGRIRTCRLLVLKVKGGKIEREY